MTVGHADITRSGRLQEGMVVQFKPSQQVCGVPIRSCPTVVRGGAQRVRVWFGAHVVADYIADPLAAARYADAMRQRFAGLRVTSDRVESSATAGTAIAKPLPSERLWELTP